MLDLDKCSQTLVRLVKALGEEYGPMGVALVAAQLSDPRAVAREIIQSDYPGIFDLKEVPNG